MRYPKLHADKLKIVIFDWDNTLAETRTPLIYAVNRVLKEYGLPEWKEVKKLRDNNLSFRDNFPRIFGSRADEAYRKYAEIYLRSVAGLISTFAGTHEVLSWLKRRHVRLAIMTNKDRRLLEFELPLLFRPDIFDRVVCGHEALHDTPYPEHALYTLRGFVEPADVSPETVWIVGDSPQDSVCACAVNALPIRIGHPIWGDEEEYAENILHYDTFLDFYHDLQEIRA